MRERIRAELDTRARLVNNRFPRAYHRGGYIAASTKLALQQLRPQCKARKLNGQRCECLASEETNLEFCGRHKTHRPGGVFDMNTSTKGTTG